MGEFRIEITEIISEGGNSFWWVTVSGSGSLAVRTIGKTFLDKDNAVNFAKGYLAGYREPGVKA